MHIWIRRVSVAKPQRACLKEFISKSQSSLIAARQIAGGQRCRISGLQRGCQRRSTQSGATLFLQNKRATKGRLYPLLIIVGGENSELPLELQKMGDRNRDLRVFSYPTTAREERSLEPSLSTIYLSPLQVRRRWQPNRRISSFWLQETQEEDDLSPSRVQVKIWSVWTRVQKEL